MGTEKNHDSHRLDRILRFFLRPEIGQFSPHLDSASLLSYSVNLEKREKSTGENSKQCSGEGAPKLQISVPCRSRTCPEKCARTFFTQTFSTPPGVRDIPAKFPGYPRFLSSKPKEDKLSREGTNFSATTPSRGRPPLHREVSGPKKLIFVLVFSLTDFVSFKRIKN